MTKLIVVRHGQSQWNLDNRFTGWVDVDLTPIGREQAKECANRLINAKLGNIDIVYTSRLKRAIKTMWIMLEQLDLMWINVYRDWRLNERHYGALQGLNKKETVDKFGKDQVQIWRRSYATAPEPLSTDSHMYPGNDVCYKDIAKELLPRTESLLTVRERIESVWQDTIATDVAEGKQVLIVAHGNSLRALAMLLCNMSADEIVHFDIPTGVPLVFDMYDQQRASKMYFLEK